MTDTQSHAMLSQGVPATAGVGSAVNDTVRQVGETRGAQLECSRMSMSPAPAAAIPQTPHRRTEEP